MKQILLLTLTLISLKAFAGGNGVERMELPEDVRAQVEAVLASRCSGMLLQPENMSIDNVALASDQQNFMQGANILEVTVNVRSATSEMISQVRMKFVRTELYSANNLQLLSLDASQVGLCN